MNFAADYLLSMWRKLLVYVARCTFIFRILLMKQCNQLPSDYICALQNLVSYLADQIFIGLVVSNLIIQNNRHSFVQLDAFAVVFTHSSASWVESSQIFIKCEFSWQILRIKQIHCQKFICGIHRVSDFCLDTLIYTVFLFPSKHFINRNRARIFQPKRLQIIISVRRFCSRFAVAANHNVSQLSSRCLSMCECTGVRMSDNIGRCCVALARFVHHWRRLSVL